MKITLNSIDDVFKAKKCTVDTMELKGYTLIDTLFADSSGLGASNEPALTQSQLVTEVNRLIREHGNLTAKITSCGQFQVYIGFFKKTGESQIEKIGNNTYRIDTKDGYKVRLHDTDVIEYKGNTVILNSGGYRTNTTKDRINKYLPQNITLLQKNFEWYVRKNDETVPFTDNMIINY